MGKVIQFIFILILCGMLIAGCRRETSPSQKSSPWQEARKSANISGYTISKVQRWLHEKALKKIEPETGLYRPEGDFNYQDVWADCYPFLVWAAWLTDLEAFDGPVRKALHAEIASYEKGSFARPEHIFGGSEYVKDGLVPIVEITGKDEWFRRMKDIQDEIWENPSVHTKFGNIPSKNIEINGEQIQVLVRLYTMTGEKKYLDFAERIADYYLLDKVFFPKRLRDHGCEIIGGFGLLLGVTSVHHPEKAKIYQPRIKEMLDTILAEGTNEDGMMYNVIGGKTQLSDGWGYNYVSYLCYDLAVGYPEYQQHLKNTLRNLSKPLYKNYSWEKNEIDGFADSIEGGLYIMNRLPVPEALAWADREVAVHIVAADDPLESAVLWGTIKYESNGVRTAIMHALTHTCGLIARPWTQDMILGAYEEKNRLFIVLKSGKDWTGKLFFDIPRHRLYMGFTKDWPRMNTLPEWYTVEPEQYYRVTDKTSGAQELYSGRQLYEGLPVVLKAGIEKLLIISK